MADKIYGVVHCYIGEEVVAVGVCGALDRDDRTISTHRGHGHCIAKGADLNRHDGRALWATNGLLQGQRRLDAHRRFRHRNARRQWDRRDRV
jgi:pyruvate dehydrogenase E1 component alpha subunit